MPARLQYALVDRAAALGWQASRIVVIDEDLGRSGASAVARPGFQRLVSEVSLGHVGLVLGIEMSRLARSGKDFYQLLKLCALSGALLADTDGMYDPVVVPVRIVDPVRVGQQRPGQRTQLDQLMPVPPRPRQPRHL
jgi:hypothetical protein